MLTQGAMRQRRRREMESAEERRERLSRDAERKRLKRMQESAEQAAWRRMVDALRKKEKRMRERETKAKMVQSIVGSADLVGMGTVSGGEDSLMKVVRPYPRKRRPRHPVTCVGDYFLTFPEGMADPTECGGGCGPGSPYLYDFANGNMPSTSRASNYGNAFCCPPREDDPQRKRHWANAGPWCSDSVTPAATSDSSCVGVAHGAREATPGAYSAEGNAGEREEFADSSPEESLSALSPEVIISEVKPEPSEEDDDQFSNEKIRHAALSALSPEVIIREVRTSVPPGFSDGHFGRAARINDYTGQHLRGQWFASSAMSINALPVQDGHREGAGAAIYSGGRPRGDCIMSM